MPEEISDKGAMAGRTGKEGVQLPAIGATLRAARERLGLSVTDVSGSIKFAPRQIEALEADDFAHLPEVTFVRGFVRSYAKLLNIEPATLLAALPKVEKQVIPPEAATGSIAVPFPGVYSERKPNIIWLVAALVIAVALALSVWVMSNSSPKFERRQVGIEQPDKVAVQSIALPVPVPVSGVMAATATSPQAALAPSPVPATSDTGSGMIRLEFDGISWVEVKDRSGNVLLSKINPQGTVQNINGNPPFSLVIGAAKGVHLYYKGKAIDLAPYTNISVARLKLE